MSKPRILVMAQGAGSRWGKGHKCLAEIAGESLISRLVRQLKELRQDNIIVVAEAEAFRPYVDGVTILEIRQPSPEVCHGIRDTAHLWSGQKRIIILLGDTVYSWVLLKTILSDTADVRFYGRLKPNLVTGKVHTERYALAFERHCGNLILKEVASALRQKAYPPTLKALYYSFIGVPFFERDTQVYFEDNLLYQVTDYTDDIDSPEELEASGARLEQAIAEEERIYHGKKAAI